MSWICRSTRSRYGRPVSSSPASTDSTVDRLADAQLVVSELVTNALDHAGLGQPTVIRLSVSRHGNRLRIDVDDAGTFTADSDTFAKPSPGRHRRGHGLRIVQALAIHWQAADGRVTAWLDV